MRIRGAPWVGAWLAVCIGGTGSGAGAAAPAAPAGPDSGLIGHWPMDEGEGYVIRDAAGQLGDGEQIGAEWVPLKRGYCLKLGAPFQAGLMEAIEGRPVPNTPGAVFHTQASAVNGRAYARIPTVKLCQRVRQGGLREKTMTLWAKPLNGGRADPAQGEQGFLLFGATYYLSVLNGRWSAVIKSSYKDGSTSIAGPAAEDGRWVHLALMNDRALARFYINGREVDPERGPYLITNLAMPPTPKTCPAVYLSVGQGERARLPPAFAGCVDDFRIYSRALSPDEVAAEYQAGLAEHAE